MKKDLQRRRLAAINNLDLDCLSGFLQQSSANALWQSWFWFNHFSVYARKRHIGAVIASYWHDAIRNRLAGSFGDMLKAATLHPAMLMFLDNARNIKARPNENHARELLELHTMGLSGGYSQADVVATANIMTGWSVSLRGDAASLGKTVFLSKLHTGGAKRVLDKHIAVASADELPELLNWLALHPATANHIAHRLCQWLVADNPPATAVEDVAQTYMVSGGNLSAIWDKAQRFSEQAIKDGIVVQPKFKSPLQYVVSAVSLLAADAVVIDVRPLQRWLRLLGQPMFGRASPDGYPLSGAAWQSAGQLAQRIELAREMVAVVPRLLEQSSSQSDAQGSQWRRVSSDWLGRLSVPSRRMVERADSAADGWALLLASPEFMMV